jgi:hypothetical protein
VTSVRNSRNFRGDGPISLRSLAILERREFPVSLKSMIVLNRSRVNGTMTAGDVECLFKITLFDSGDWFITGKFLDHGDVLGDFFRLEFLVDEERGIGGFLEGQLGAGESITLSDRGNDPIIRDRWRILQANGPKVRLSATPNVSDVVVTVLTVLSVVGIVTFLIPEPGKKIEAGRCRDQPLDNHEPCVEFRKVPE